MLRTKLLAAAVLGIATIAAAQNPPGGPGPQGQPGQQGQQGRGPGQGGPGGPGGPNGMGNIDQMKAALHSNDEEWKVIAPAIRKVISARRIAEAGLLGAGNGGGMRRMGPPGGRGNDAFGGPNNTRPGGGPMGGPDGGPGGPGGQGGPGGFPPPPDGNDAPPPRPDAPQVNNADVPEAGAAARRGRQNGGQNGGPGGGPGGQGGPGQGGPGGPGGPGMMGGPPTGPVATAMAELKSLTDAGNATPEQLKAKVAAVRSAREKARAAVASAVQELEALVTAEQSAALVGLGVIE